MRHRPAATCLRWCAPLALSWLLGGSAMVPAQEQSPATAPPDHGAPALLTSGEPVAAPATPDAALPGNGAASPPDGDGLTFAAAMRLAVEGSPDVLAARRAVEAARAGVDVARERPNPDLTYERDRDLPRDAATLAFPIETGGKRQRRVELAEASTRLAEAELARAEQEVRQQVRRAYFGLAGAERQALLRRQQAELAARVRDAARARFESGDRPRLDLAQAQLELAQAEVEADGASANVAGARATLDVLIGRPADAPLVLQSDLDAAPLPAVATLTGLALSASSELARLQRQVEEQTARLQLAHALQKPDLTLAPSITHDALPDYLWGWRAAITVALPIFTTHRAEVEVERHTLEQRQAELAAARRRIEGEVARTLALAGSSQHAALSYRDQILPQTEEVERMAEDAYRSGQTGIEALLQSLQAARDTRARAIQASIDLQNALADLEQAIGAPLP